MYLIEFTQKSLSCTICLFHFIIFYSKWGENRFENLKDYYKRIKRQNKLKSGDGVAATGEGETTSGVVSNKKKKKSEWKYMYIKVTYLVP